MSSQIVEIRFSGEPPDKFLSISVEGRAYHRSKDYWDGNWLLVNIAFQVGKFSGRIPGLLRAEEFEDFAEDLRAFHQALTADVSFTTMENWFSLHIEPADKLGHIRIAGTISDEVGDPANTLTFTLLTDQTFLPAALQQLEQVIEAFPVIGKP